MNLPRPKHERKSAVQLLNPLAALRVPRVLCGGFSRLCGALSVYSLHAIRSTPIHLHRRDATGTQRKPRCVAVLHPRLVIFGRSSKHHSLALAATRSQKLKGRGSDKQPAGGRFPEREQARCLPPPPRKILWGGWLPAGWSVSEKFSYPQNFPAPHSGARGRGLPPVQFRVLAVSDR